MSSSFDCKDTNPTAMALLFDSTQANDFFHAQETVIIISNGIQSYDYGYYWNEFHWYRYHEYFGDRI